MLLGPMGKQHLLLVPEPENGLKAMVQVFGGIMFLRLQAMELLPIKKVIRLLKKLPTPLRREMSCRFIVSGIVEPYQETMKLPR